MIRLLTRKKQSPIGVDPGARSVKLVQLSADRSQLLASSVWEMPAGESHAPGNPGYHEHATSALTRALEAQRFRGNAAVLCLGHRELFLQNIRVPRADGDELQRLVHQEAAGRLPFPVAEAEIRFLTAGDVRQGESIMREVIVFACHRPLLDAKLAVVEAAGLRPVAVDVEPLAMLRANVNQFRRDEDHTSRTLFVHIGYQKTAIVIAQGDKILFVKYIETGGEQFDQAVASHLGMTQSEAASIRRRHDDRAVESQDPEISRSIAEAIRPVIDQIRQEISLCVRYHSVTFRGQPLSRLLLSGGEASPGLNQTIAANVNFQCDLSQPLRGMTEGSQQGRGMQADRRATQWDVATGLALKEVE